MKIIDKIALDGTKNGCISIAKLGDAYGEKSGDVISIAICLKDEQIEWKVHIPVKNLDEVIKSLEKAKNL